MWRDSAFEYGLAAQMHRIAFAGSESRAQGNFIRQRTILANPSIPVTAFVNYCHHRGKANAYIGANAGVVFALGKDMMDAQGLQRYSRFDVYFHDALAGCTFGIQLGFRRTIGRFDAGGQIGGNFMDLSLTQGVSNHPYSYKVLTWPVQAYVGYSF
jgi:hypothetical protein